MKRLAGCVALALALAVAGAAHAHAHLLQATPADGGVLTQGPVNFAFRFSEAATLTALSVQRAGGEAQKVPLPAAPAATDISVPAPALSPGDYTLTYRVLSADHHIVSGHLQFKVSG